MTTITWFILVSLFFHTYARMRVDQPLHGQLSPGRPPLAQTGLGRPQSAQTCPGWPLPAQPSPGRPAYHWQKRIWRTSCPRRSWPRPLRTWLRWQPCPLRTRCWPRMTLPSLCRCLLLQYAPPKDNACVLSTSSCVLVGSREALHGGMGGDDSRPHRCGKGGRKALFISEPPDTYICGSCLLVSSPPRMMHKKEPKTLTSVAVVMAVRRPLWCIAVCSSSFVLIFYAILCI